MSSRNPKRSSRLAAKEDKVDERDARKRGRAAGADTTTASPAPQASPIAQKPAAAPAAAASSPSTRRAAESSAAAPAAHRRAGGQQAPVPDAANQGKASEPAPAPVAETKPPPAAAAAAAPAPSPAPGAAQAAAPGAAQAAANAAHSTTENKANAVAPQTTSGYSSRHQPGVSVANAASARKEASFTAQARQPQQQSSNRPVVIKRPETGLAQSAAQSQAQRPQQQRASLSGGYAQHGSPMPSHSMPGVQKSYQAQHASSGSGGGAAGYAAANGRKAHAEGVAGEGVRTSRPGDQRMSGYRQDASRSEGGTRQVLSHGSGQSQQSLQQSLVVEDLRKGLSGAVDRWISARNSLPGEDSGRFPSEIHRLAQLIAFETCEKGRAADQAVASDPSDASDGVIGREVVTTRFRLAHPDMQKVPFVFQATHHSLTGTTGTGHHIKGLRWKVEFELIGFFLLALHTQTLDLGEEVWRQKLNEVRAALNTFISSSELGVLLMLAGNANKGANAWNDVEKVCFWTSNFSLPEFRVT